MCSAQNVVGADLRNSHESEVSTGSQRVYSAIKSNEAMNLQLLVA